jgi:hypothetical protein
MSDVSVFKQDATPTGRREGDLWIKQPDQVYVCTDVPGNVWQAVANQPVGTFHPYIGVLTDTMTRASFTDGGGASGTRVMAGVIPVGAILLGSKLTVNTAFIGDTSATMTVGDGSDVDRYNTGTPDVFSGTGLIQTGVPSGNKLITTANSPTVTVTSNADFTNVTAGSMTLSIYYLATV